MEKNACYRKYIQSVLKNLNEFFGLSSSLKAFWSWKNDLKFLIKNVYLTIFRYENYKIVILSWKKINFQKSPKNVSE